ncbi:enoyl-CoA hydratase/isomerase family protein [Saccharomonospora sp. NPDC046836]|uniref:enoyl-CoA hydratase/isomerase family protein n=1 Tax=Saccharomonospora sp. NPDC046836 TaxID=3156921 RepID=UPI0033F8D788
MADDGGEPELLCETHDGLARLTINRPHRMNTLSRGLQEQMRRSFAQLADDRDVRVILVRASGERAFCAGADMKEPGRHAYSNLADYLHDQPGLFDEMRRCRQVIVSEVNGWAVGGGLQLALFSDLIYASAGARFTLPQVRLGLMPPYGTTIRLARHIGHGRAMQMSLLGSELTAEDALHCGLVQDVSPDPHTLRAHVDSIIRTLLELPPQSLLLTKNALVTGWEMSSEAAAWADRFRDYSLKRG